MWLNCERNVKVIRFNGSWYLLLWLSYLKVISEWNVGFMCVCGYLGLRYLMILSESWLWRWFVLAEWRLVIRCWMCYSGIKVILLVLIWLLAVIWLIVIGRWIYYLLKLNYEWNVESEMKAGSFLDISAVKVGFTV